MVPGEATEHEYLISVFRWWLVNYELSTHCVGVLHQGLELEGGGSLAHCGGGITHPM